MIQLAILVANVTSIIYAVWFFLAIANTQKLYSFLRHILMLHIEFRCFLMRWGIGFKDFETLQTLHMRGFNAKTTN